MNIILHGKVYDVAKWLCLIAIPAATVLYTALDATFGWGYADVINKVSSDVILFIGTIIGISTKSYKEQINA